MQQFLFDLAFYAKMIATIVIPVIFAITWREPVRGRVARLFGDDTAHIEGRLSLNPIHHIDPVGTLLVPMVLLLLSQLAGTSLILFGWAKQVPVDFTKLRNPKKDMLWVALAGPLANLLMAFMWMLVVIVLERFAVAQTFWFDIALASVMINMALMVFTLLPILPLDGGRIVFSLLPHRLAWQYSRLEPYGMIIVLVLLVGGVLRGIVTSAMAWGQAILSWLLVTFT